MTSFSELKRGSAWEYRVHRAAFLAGWYVRRGVNLRERVMGSPQTMAEVDILGLGFDPALTPRTLVGECKDRKGSTKEADRIIWLLGLSRLLRSDQVLFAKTKLSGATLQFAKPFGVALWDEAAVRDIERRFELEPDDGYFGSFNVELQETVLRPARKASAIKDRSLKAAWDYLSGAYWYRGTPGRTKLLKGYFEALYGSKAIAEDVKSGFVAEGLIALLVSGYTTAGQLNRMSPAQGASQLESALAAGAADAAALREIAARADDYYQDALRRLMQGKGAAEELTVPRLANAVAEPPEWTEAYLSFSRRLGERPLLAGDALRYADVVLFEEHLAEKDTRNLLQLVFPFDHAPMREVLALGALFLKRIWGIEDNLLERILGQGPRKGDSSKPRSVRRDQKRSVVPESLFGLEGGDPAQR